MYPINKNNKTQSYQESIESKGSFVIKGRLPVNILVHETSLCGRCRNLEFTITITILLRMHAYRDTNFNYYADCPLKLQAHFQSYAVGLTVFIVADVYASDSLGALLNMTLCRVAT